MSRLAVAVAATAALAVLAGYRTGWGDIPDAVWLVLVVVLTLAERYRLPVGVRSQTEISAVLTVFTVSLFLGPSFDLVAAAGVAATWGVLSRGRWGAPAATEIVASVAAASVAVLVAYLLYPGAPQAVAVAVAGVAYAGTHRTVVAFPGTGAPMTRPEARICVISIVVQVTAGATTWYAFSLHSTMVATRFLVVWAAVYLWLVLWRRARTWAIAVAVVKAAPDSLLPPLEDLAESLAEVAETELVAPYERPGSCAERSAGVEVAVVHRDGSCRVYRLEPGSPRRPRGRVGWWRSAYPEWVPRALSGPEAATLEEAVGAEHRPRLLVAAGPVTGPAVVVRVPVAEENGPGRRRLRALGEMYAECVAVLLDKYQTMPVCKSTQLAGACERLLDLVETRATADRVAEQVERVSALTAAAVSLNAAAPGTPGSGVGVSVGPRPARSDPASGRTQLEAGAS